jgi:hypothetical protein
MVEQNSFVIFIPYSFFPWHLVFLEVLNHNPKEFQILWGKGIQSSMHMNIVHSTNKYPQFIMGVLFQVENGDKFFWK